jgi:Uma2 family endonuclease
MNHAAAKLMTAEQFFEWQKCQDGLYELVDGIPVLYRGAKLMSGGSSMHDRIITNIIVALDAGLGDGPCRPATPDLALRTRIKSLRRADVLVTCDEPRTDRYESDDPRMVIEVLSPSNSGVAWERKLNEYRQHQKLDYILLIDAQVVDVKLYRRTRKGWDDSDFADLADTVPLPKLSCELAVAAIYRRTGLEPQKPE